MSKVGDLLLTIHFFSLLAGGAGVAIVSCKSDGRGTTSTDDILLATIDVCCKSLDTVVLLEAQTPAFNYRLRSLYVLQYVLRYVLP